MTQAIIRKPSEGRTVAVVGDVYRFLATGEDTNGSLKGPQLLPPTKDEIEKLLASAPKYGIEIKLPH